jgi:release factor glutamine methyltransferase
MRKEGSMSQEAEERWTVSRLLTWTTGFLKKKGSESPRLEAEVLLSHVLEWPRVQLYTHFEDEVGERARSRYRDLVKKRSEGMPVAYLVGQQEFFSLPMTVNPAVLIPRPDTETLVVEALERLKGTTSPRVVDVGTGSGCVALAIAKRHESARVIAIDISPEALNVAKANAQELGLADRVEFRLGDLLVPVAGEGPFDMIVSNPPYIPSADIDGLEPGVRDYEPHLALDGGVDGLDFYLRLIDEAAAILSPGGPLILEIGSAQEVAVHALIAARKGWASPVTIRDAANQPRVIRTSRS